MIDATNSATGQLCRVRVVADSTRFEVALPADVPLADLMPVLLSLAGPDLADAGLDHAGWVVQRLGEPSLNEDESPAQLGLCDGDTLHLKPRRAAMPAIDYDDLADGVAEQIDLRPDRWRPALTRWAFRLATVLALLTGLAVVLVGGDERIRALAAGSAAVLLVLAASGVTRALRDTMSGTMIALVGICYGAVAGWLLPTVIRADLQFTAANLACAAVAVLSLTCLALAGIADAGLLFIPLLAVAVLVALGAGIDAVTSADPLRSAAVLLVLALVLATFVPMTSFRMAGLSLPQLPTGSEDLTDDIDPIPATVVVDRTRAADRYMVALTTALGVVWTGCFTVLVWFGGWEALTLTGTVCLVLVLRSRSLTGGWQRAALLLAAGYGLASLALLGAVSAPPLARMVGVLLGLLVVAAFLLVAGRILPGRRLRPLWGRSGDILESVAAVATFPLLLAVLEVYQYIRAMAS